MTKQEYVANLGMYITELKRDVEICGRTRKEMEIEVNTDKIIRDSEQIICLLQTDIDLMRICMKEFAEPANKPNIFKNLSKR